MQYPLYYTYHLQERSIYNVKIHTNRTPCSLFIRSPNPLDASILPIRSPQKEQISQQQTQETNQFLLHLWEEEKLAHDVYTALGNQYLLKY